jgi:ATP-dependent Clp protease ATP-binding subunit ClpC
MTSNIGTGHRSPLTSATMAFLKRGSDLRAEQEKYWREKVMAEVKNSFRSELLNRIDEVIVFRSLRTDHLRYIVDLQIEQTRQRLGEREITLQISDAVCLRLVELGYDPEYGARPLRRTVQRLLDDMLAEALLRREISDGDQITIDVLNGEISISQVVSRNCEVVA